MATIITRTGKGAPLTNTEVDANFTNLNADVASTQLQLAQTTAVATANTASILSQDLSAVSAALHRSPNAVTAMFLYDTSKDSDGGAWIERMQHTSWANEPLAGAWLPGGFATELLARGDNLLSYPEELTNAQWNWNTAVAVTPNTGDVVDPFGGNKAQKVLITTANDRHYVGRTFSGSTAVMATSVYVKAGTATKIGLAPPVNGLSPYNYTNTYLAVFDLTSGTVVYTGTNIPGTATITAAGGGWYKISWAGGNGAGGNTFSLAMVDQAAPTTFSFVGNGTDYFYAYGAKINQVGVLPSTYSASPELVSNGGFDNGTVGWTTTGGAIQSVVNGKLQVTTAAGYERSNATVSGLITGNVYALQCDFDASATGTYLEVSGAGFNRGSALSNLARSEKIVFVADATSVTLAVIGTGTGTFSVDNATCKKVTTLATPYVPYSTQTNSYYQSSADGKYYKLGSTYGALTEVFRGNKAKFPRLAMIVLEGLNGSNNSVAIYDLTEPGRPMWMRFIQGGTAFNEFFLISSAGAASTKSVAALNGKLCVGLVGAQPYVTGLRVVDFASDKMREWNNSSNYTSSFGIAARNSGIGFWNDNHPLGVLPGIGNAQVNAVAMTVLPDAPFDVVTGIQIPTIALATGGGVSVIKHDGTVVNKAWAPSINYRISIVGNVVFTTGGSSDGYWGVMFWDFVTGIDYRYGSGGFNKLPPFAILGDTTDTPIIYTKSVSGMSGGSVNPRRLVFLKENISTKNKGASAYIESAFNTGYMLGDIRRAYFCNTEVESVTGTELVTNGTFDTGITGWTSGNAAGTSISWDGVGALQLTNTGPGDSTAIYSFSAVIGQGYVLSLSMNVGGYLIYIGPTAGSSSTLYASGGNKFSFTATATTQYLTVLYYPDGNYTALLDNVSIKAAILDRSYKAAGASIVGTLTKTPVAAAAQLVAFSGFGVANYIQEPYSADLDFGTGEFSVGAYVTYPSLYNVLTKTQDIDDAIWAKVGTTIAVNSILAPDGSLTADKLVLDTTNGVHYVNYTGSYNGDLSYSAGIYLKAAGSSKCALTLSMPNFGRGVRAIVDFASGTVTAVNVGSGSTTYFTWSIENAGNGWFKVLLTGIVNFGTAYYYVELLDNLGSNTFLGDGVSGAYVWGADLRTLADASKLPAYQRVNTITDFAGSSGFIAERSQASGAFIKFGLLNSKISATVFDGTTTRTVTTPSTYNTGISTKATANYTAAGKLSINVNGVEVAAVTGAPLLTMNNAAAVLTIGNSRTLDAPFPGSITLLKIGATVPTPEQEAWMYEQEKQMFRSGAQITLPDATPVLDLSYDESQDKWVALQAGRESSFTGLIRTASATPSAGNFTKVVASSGVKALARNATNPGVDIQISAYGLREELVKRSEAAAKASKTLTVFDFDSVAGQTDFVLPMGWKTTSVVSAGNMLREGSTKNFIRLFDGFRETIRFAVAPGAGVWIRINAIKE